MNDSYAVSKQCINSWENMHMKCRRIRKQIVHTTELYDSHAASSALILGENMHMKCRSITKQITHTTEI